MSKKKKPIITKLISYGLYAKWSNSCDELPKFLKHTTTIPGRIESEFGFMLEIKNGRGKNVDYVVKHPRFTDQNNNVEPIFTGTIPIRKSPFTVYIGETLWEPIDDKIGSWELTAKIDGKVIHREKFNIVKETTLFDELIEENSRRHIK